MLLHNRRFLAVGVAVHFFVLLPFNGLSGKGSGSDELTGVRQRQFESGEVRGTEGRGVLPFPGLVVEITAGGDSDRTIMWSTT